MSLPSIHQPLDYLTYSVHFAALRSKARKVFWENRASPEDLPVIREIIRISPTDSQFETEVQSSPVFQQKDRVESVIRRLMEMAPPTPKRAAAATPKRDSGSFSFPKPPEEPDIKEAVASENPFTDTESFELLAAKARGAIQRKSFSGMKEALAKQILSAQLLIDQCMPLPEAFERCLGEKVLEKTISDCYLPPSISGDKSAFRQSLFMAFVQELSKEEPVYIPVRAKSAARPALPQNWRTSSPKSRSFSGLPASPKKEHQPPQRSRTLIALSSQLQEYPPQLHDPSIMRQMVEGAVLLRYLFPERNKKLFKSKAELAVIEQLIDLGIMSRYAIEPYPACLAACFKQTSSDEQETVFKKLLAKQTITKLQKAPKIPTDFPLPDGFAQPPFDHEASTEALLGLLAYTRFKLAGCYSQYTKEEKRIMRLLLQAGQIRDMLRMSFTTSLKIVLSQSDPVAGSDLQSMVIRSNLGMKPVSETYETAVNGEEELARLLHFPYLKHARYFPFYLERVRMVLPTANPTTVRAGELLLAVASRVEREPITLGDALKSSFTLRGMERLFNSEDTAKNLVLLERALQNFAPGVFVHHAAFDTAESFASLLKAEPPPPDAQALKVYDFLQTIRKEMEADPSLTFSDAVIFHFNHESIRKFFASEDDRTNTKEMVRCLDFILKRECAAT